MNKFYFDIETLPAGKDKHALLKKFHEMRTKQGKTKSSFEDFLSGTSFGGTFGRIICIAYAFNDEPVRTLSGEEKNIIQEFWKIAPRADLFIGHNVLFFDLNFIRQRSIILGIKPTRKIDMRKYYSNDVYDIMQEWSNWTSNISMDELAHAFGIPSSKSKMDGSQVASFHEAGRDEEIYEYCCADVEVTRAIYKKMNFEE
jgi:predicted PolB exonuclease-like 3'-5' exonuclease